MSRVSRKIDRLDVIFDEPTLVANAGLIVPATLMTRLGLEALINSTVRLVGRVGGALPGRKVLTLVATILAGGSHIDHADLLRAGATRRVLGFRVMAPSTLGTFLRSFTFGHIRQLDKMLGEALRRAWRAGAGPDADAVTIDLDSTICEVHGKHKQGAAYGYTRVLGYHPLLATRADTGEVLHARLRKGSSQRGAKRFVEELIARVRRAGATGALVVRADSGFWSYALIDTLTRLRVGWSITVTVNPQVRACIDAINETEWQPIDYPAEGQAAVAETTYVTGRGPQRRELRLVVRRTRLVDPAQAALWPDWRYHAFITSLDAPVVAVDQFHRDHASVELAIRDLKEGAGLEHCPSGHFSANAAWLACAVLAHNLWRWTVELGDLRPDRKLTVARTVRTRLVALPGRLVNRAGRLTLRLPAHWPWADQFLAALTQLRTLPNPRLTPRSRRAHHTPTRDLTRPKTGPLTTSSTRGPTPGSLNQPQQRRRLPNTPTTPNPVPNRWIEAKGRCSGQSPPVACSSSGSAIDDALRSGIPDGKYLAFGSRYRSPA